MRVDGADKVWKQMRRERITVARCTVERLMKRWGLQGVRRGKVVRTTISHTAALRPLDRVNRQFKADRPISYECRTSRMSRPGRAGIRRLRD